MCGTGHGMRVGLQRVVQRAQSLCTAAWAVPHALCVWAWRGKLRAAKCLAKLETASLVAQRGA